MTTWEQWRMSWFSAEIYPFGSLLLFGWKGTHLILRRPLSPRDCLRRSHRITNRIRSRRELQGLDNWIKDFAYAFCRVCDRFEPGAPSESSSSERMVVTVVNAEVPKQQRLWSGWGSGIGCQLYLGRFRKWEKAQKLETYLPHDPLAHPTHLLRELVSLSQHHQLTGYTTVLRQSRVSELVKPSWLLSVLLQQLLRSQHARRLLHTLSWAVSCGECKQKSCWGANHRRKVSLSGNRVGIEGCFWHKRCAASLACPLSNENVSWSSVQSFRITGSAVTPVRPIWPIFGHVIRAVLLALQSGLLLRA